jgi:hypothetical protein
MGTYMPSDGKKSIYLSKAQPREPSPTYKAQSRNLLGSFETLVDLLGDAFACGSYLACSRTRLKGDLERMGSGVRLLGDLERSGDCVLLLSVARELSLVRSGGCGVEDRCVMVSDSATVSAARFGM